MENFSLKSFFSGTDVENNIGNNSQITVNNIFNNSSTNVHHDSKILLNYSKKKKIDVKKIYEDEYNSCWEQIYDANKQNLDYVYYTVPKINVNCDIYNSLICLQHIQKKLLNHKIGSTITNSYQIFISWQNIEELLEDN